MRKQLLLVTILIFFQLQLSIHAQDEKLAAQQNSLNQISAANTQVKGIEGIWEGTLEAGGAKVRLVVKVTKKPDGTLTAAMDSPDQGVTGITLDYINFKDNIVTFELKAGGALFEGTLNKEETAIIGQWKQGGGSFALTLNRTDKAPVTLLRPQEPKKPFPYDEEEVSYENKKAGVRLAGSLTLPRTKGPHPAVLLITGSGQQDRNEAMLGHKPFLVLADYLTRRGIAVLRVDDRGVGGSTAGVNINNATSEDFAEDVLSGIEFLKSRKEIDSKKIGLIGHSEGGIIAPLVAAKSTDVAFIVLMAGPGLKAEEGFPVQIASVAKANGASDESIAWNRKFLDQVFIILKQEKDNAVARKRIAETRTKMLSELSEEQRKKLGVSENTSEDVVKLMLKPWFKFYLNYDPYATLKKVRVPVFALVGERDLQVAPPKQNLAAIEKALKAGGNKDFTTAELPKLNHLFQTSETGAPSEYGKIEETISPEVLDLIANWIIKHTVN